MFNFLNILFQNVPRCSSNISLTVKVLVKKMKHKTIALALILTLLLVPTPILMAQETEQTPEETIDPAVLNKIKTQAIVREQEMIGFFGGGPFSPEMENCLQNAQQAMEQAQYFEENNPQAAAQQYMSALKHYRNALRKFVEENPQKLDYFEGPIDPESAGDDIEIILQNEIDAAKTQLLNRFQERYREQIQVMIENVEEVEDDLSPQDAEKARQALMQTLEKTLRIQERIHAGEYDVAVDELDEAIEFLDGEFEGLEGQGITQMLKSMNSIEATIQKVRQVAARKAEVGGDTSIEDDMLEELVNSINEMKHDYNESKGDESELDSQGNPGKGNN